MERASMMLPDPHEPASDAQGEGSQVDEGQSEPREVTGSGASIGRRRKPAWLIAAIAVAPFVLVLGAFAIDRAAHSGEVLRGVQLRGVSIDGQDLAKAKETATSVGAPLLGRELEVHVLDGTFALPGARLGIRVDAERTAQDALAEGRSGSLAAQFRFWLGRLRSPIEVPLSFAADDSTLLAELAKMNEEAVHELPFEGRIALVEGSLSAEYPHGGRAIDVPAARAVLLDAVASERVGRIDLPLRDVLAPLAATDVDAALDRAHALAAGPIDLRWSGHDGQAFRLQPDELAEMIDCAFDPKQPTLRIAFDPKRLEPRLAEIRAVLESPARNAAFVIDSHDRIQITPGSSGTRIDATEVAAALLRAADAPGRSGTLLVTQGAEPELSTADAEALHIDGLVSTFTTHHPCCQPRVKNIHRIADRMNDVIVKPGVTFSVNEYVGPRTERNGFVAAPSIEDGEMVDTVGGGVSQFATTLYNAIFRGGYDIVQRQPHSFYFSRYPAGHEATLSWPKPDFVFRNDTEAGLLIKTAYDSTTITVKIYGNNGGRKVAAKVGPRIDSVPPPIELLPNPDLDPTEEKVKDAGEPGWSIVVSRLITFADGTTKEEPRRVTYKPRPRRIEVHPCLIPKGEPGASGKPCPEPTEEAALTEEKSGEVDAHVTKESDSEKKSGVIEASHDPPYP